MTEQRRARAVFMAFGTKGDVFPLAAIANAFASDQWQYDVIFITHSVYGNLTSHLEAKSVGCYLITSPPVLSICDDNIFLGDSRLSSSGMREVFKIQHRRECLSIVERIFGDGPSVEADIIVINFFALEGWNLAELFRVHCVVAAPYVVPYSAPASFERRFKKEFPDMYRYFQEAPVNQVSLRDLLHWMWPLFTEEWGSWRHDCLNLSALPFTDPVTCLPMWHLEEQSPLLLYGFSKEIVECPGYWPSNIHVCGFWFLPMEWQFSCPRCADRASLCPSTDLTGSSGLCLLHLKLQNFLEDSKSLLIFVGLSSIGSMGFIQNPSALLMVLNAVLEREHYHIVLFTAGYEPLNAAIMSYVQQSSSCAEVHMNNFKDEGILLNSRLFCFSGSVPYSWLFPKCAVAVHHGGSGSTASALHAGVPQIVCPFILDQFYWAERMHWLGVAPEPLQRNVLVPEDTDVETIRLAARGLSEAIASALSPGVKERAREIKENISSEDGIQEAVNALKKEIFQC